MSEGGGISLDDGLVGFMGYLLVGGGYCVLL